MRHTLLVTFIALLVCLPATARADMSAATIHATLQNSFAPDGPAGLAVVAKRGARFQHISVAERLPNGSVLVEATLAYEGKAIRFPVRLRRTDKPPRVWEITWDPAPEYGEALLSMIDSGRLPKTPTAPAWKDAPRLPALPLIVTKKRLVTPFGPVELEKPPTQENAEPPASDLQHVIGLVKHSKRWIEDVLENDPGPAGLDVIADEEIDWKRLNDVLFSVSAVGLYQVFLVGASASEITALPLAAPVGVSRAMALPSPVVVGMYRVGENAGFRVGHEGDIFRTKNPCDPEMSFCSNSPEAFVESLKSTLAEHGPKKPAKTELAMFAATGEIRLKEAARFLDTLRPTLELAPHRLLLGYIQR